VSIDPRLRSVHLERQVQRGAALGRCKTLISPDETWAPVTPATVLCNAGWRNTSSNSPAGSCTSKRKHRVWTEARTTLPNGARIDVDGYRPDPLTYAEVFARQGKLKGGQIQKVAQDVLKLVTVRKLLAPNAQLYVVFADKSAAAIPNGRGWLAEAARAWDVKPLVVRLDTKLRGELNKAQDRQRMINPPQD